MKRKRALRRAGISPGLGGYQRGFSGWEIVVGVVLALIIVVVGAVRLKKGYSQCLEQGYSLTECVLNTTL